MERRKRLKPELQGAGPDAIREAALRGEAINEEHEHPKLVFSGDTTIEFIEHNEVAQQADILIMEVSFIDDRVSVERSKNGHIHLDEVIARAELFKNKAILFTHLSARYREQEAFRRSRLAYRTRSRSGSAVGILTPLSRSSS